MSAAPIPPENSHPITLALAIEMTTRYRANKDKIINSEFAGREILALSETFHKKHFLAFLTRPECAGFRIYYGMDADLKIHAILVGVDQAGNDILPDILNSVSLTDGGGQIFDDGQRCPPYCPGPSPLNG